jgi:hypothetical protein
MNGILWPLVAFIPFFVLLMLHGRGRSCPACGGPLAGFQSPLAKTRRQWIEGGYLCRRCGCESDLAGSRVAPGGGYNYRALHISVALLAATAITGATLIALLLWPHS